MMMSPGSRNSVKLMMVASTGAPALTRMMMALHSEPESASNQTLFNPSATLVTYEIATDVRIDIIITTVCRKLSYRRIAQADLLWATWGNCKTKNHHRCKLIKNAD